MFKELDLIIQDHCVEYRMNGPEDVEGEINDQKYDELREEINAYIHADNPNWTSLSEEAQAILKEWEELKEKQNGNPV